MKKLLYSLILIATLIGRDAYAVAVVPQPDANAWMGGDPLTSMIGTIASLIASFSEPEMGATVNVIQEEVDALEAGSENYVQAEMDGSATSQGFSTKAYDYVRQHLFEGGASIVETDDENSEGGTTSSLEFTTVTRTAWPYLNNRISDTMTVDDTRKLVIDTFFIENTDDLTEEKIDEVNNRRTEYLQAIGSGYSLLAQEVQTRLIEDLESVNTTTFNGDGLIGAVTGVDQTWLAATRGLMADIALQLQLLEVDAAAFLQLQPVEILSAPTGLKSGDGDQGGDSMLPYEPNEGENT